MTDRLRVHVDQQTWKPPYMRLTPEVWAEAARRRPELAAKLDLTFSDDWTEIGSRLADADIVICQGKPPEAVVKAAKNLKWIMATSAGIETMAPFDWLPASVRLSNNSGTHYPKTKEFAAMALAMLHFQTPHLATSQRDHAWAPRLDGLIAGKSVVVVGFGTLGQATAEAAKGLGLEVRAVRRNPASHPLADSMHAPDDLLAAAANADFLVCTLPLTETTRGFIGADAFDALKPGAGVVNIGRGPVMDYTALTPRLDDGRLSGAILDVFDKEPLAPESPLWDQKNLTIFPHMSSDDPTSYIPRSLDIFFENLDAFLAGAARLPNEIDRATGY